MTDEQSGNGVPSDEQPLDSIQRNPMGSPQPYETCGARKRNGEPCRAAAMTNGKCRIHGGRSPGGVASPHFRHGRRSRYLNALPPKLRSAYRAALADPDLVSVKAEMAMLAARSLELLGQLQDVHVPPWHESLTALESLLAADTPDKTRAAIDRLKSVLRGGCDATDRQNAIWTDLRALFQERGKLARTEYRRLHDLHALVTVEEALGFAKAFLVAAKEVIVDRETLRRLQDRTMHLLQD